MLHCAVEFLVGRSQTRLYFSVRCLYFLFHFFHYFYQYFMKQYTVNSYSFLSIFSDNFDESKSTTSCRNIGLQRGWLKVRAHLLFPTEISRFLNHSLFMKSCSLMQSSRFFYFWQLLASFQLSQSSRQV